MKPENEAVSLFVVHWNQPAECIATMEALGHEGWDALDVGPAK